MNRALGFCALLLASACVAPMGSEPVGDNASPIVDGTLERGYPEVVYLYNIRGAACTATIVAPRLVLTAKHCVQNISGVAAAAPASDLRVLVGTSAGSAVRQYTVQEVRPAPGRWDLQDGSDVAVLILATAATEMPREMAFDSPSGIFGQPFTAIGYGQRPDDLRGGVKYRTEKTVQGSRGQFIFVEPAVCSGDSGGPLIGADGRVWGVASFIYSPDGAEPSCGTAPGAYNSIYNYRAFIEQALEDSGACVPSEELCDGIDNDCDGDLDEGCTPIGVNCSRDDECAGQRCEELVAGEGTVCTQECDPVRPSIGCPSGFYCSSLGLGMCGGLCAAGSVGEGLIESACEANTDCITGYCVDPGDGMKRCLAPCRGDRGDCLADEVCVAAPDSCGACVPSGIYGGQHGIGEPCDSNAECLSDYCFDDDGSSYCSRPCTDDDACGDGFHCREMSCARGPRQGTGGGCISNDDCASGFCASAGGRSWCSAFCMADDECPAGFSCTPVDATRNVCAPDLGLVGDSCGANEDCISGLCAMGTRAGSICTQMCGPDTACSPGFECNRVDGGMLSVCLPPADDGRGCAAGGSPGTGFGFAMVFVAVLFGRRRRRG